MRYKSYLLPPGPGVLESKPERTPGKSVHYLRKSHIGNLHLLNALETSLLDLPVIDAYMGPLPQFLVPFHEARKKVIQPGSFVHFYIDDYHFERLWNNPERYLPLLQQYDGVIGTDFSQFANMPYPQRLWNCYRNRLLGSWMQKHGINYIHNVTWSLPDSYGYSFEGLPAGSVIAINCAGIAGSPTSKYLWYRGYEEALSRLKPVAIVRYGTRMLEENEAISRYFENERLNLLRNGR